MRASEFLFEDNPDYDEDRFLKSDPGTPIPFPKGTTLVNVSDVYDWYKLGMAVSDLDDADPREFNRGVPHTVFAFGSEEEEHKMIPLLKRLGFSLHDIDSPEDYQKAIRASDVMEHLEEMAGKVHGGVRKELAKQGYKYLGSGIDKQAYLEPGTGQILVIFGYGKWSKGKFSPDQLTFVNWAKYCQQNSNNPHLPRFSGWESFDYQGQRYLQIRMEPLRELPQNLKDIVYWLEDYIDEQGKIDSKKVAKRIGNQGVEEFDYDKGDFYQKKVKAKKIIEYLGGAQAAAGLMKTVQIAKRMANKEDVTLDLHGGNYMQRADGTIVVNDPFVTTFF